jgi:hypothetical protein
MDKNISARKLDWDEIPVIDLSPWFHGNTGDQKIRTFIKIAAICTLANLAPIQASAQQETDQTFIPKNTHVSFNKENAPAVFIDEAHYNFHTKEGRYSAFSKVLESDGYIVKPNTVKFSSESLAGVDVLVIANALNKKNEDDWNLPNYSAFKRNEIETVHAWVKGGGSLFLIADHHPFPKASEDLAAIFGFHFNNGYVQNPSIKLAGASDIFSTSEKTLKDHPILRGRSSSETVDRVRTFTGQAFISPKMARPLIVLPDEYISYMPAEEWDLSETTPTIPVEGWHQGATLEFGKGRIVVFAEAAMFTAQRHGETWFGMSANDAPQNEQFLLNIMHWLSGDLK